MFRIRPVAGIELTKRTQFTGCVFSSRSRCMIWPRAGWAATRDHRSPWRIPSLRWDRQYPVNVDVPCTHPGQPTPHLGDGVRSSQCAWCGLCRGEGTLRLSGRTVRIALGAQLRFEPGIESGTCHRDPSSHLTLGAESRGDAGGPTGLLGYPPCCRLDTDGRHEPLCLVRRALSVCLQRRRPPSSRSTDLGFRRHISFRRTGSVRVSGQSRLQPDRSARFGSDRVSARDASAPRL